MKTAQLVWIAAGAQTVFSEHWDITRLLATREVPIGTGTESRLEHLVVLERERRAGDGAPAQFDGNTL